MTTRWLRVAFLECGGICLLLLVVKLTFFAFFNQITIFGLDVLIDVHRLSVCVVKHATHGFNVYITYNIFKVKLNF